MKFKKDGKVFEDIWDARFAHCITVSVCKWCNVGANSAKDCINLCKDMPTEAARLMGYEVVEDVPDIYVGEKEASIDKRKPLKDWTLEEPQNICAATGSDCKGCPFAEPGICRVNGIPEIWDLSEKPRFTEAEVAFAKAMYAVIPDGVIMRTTENTLSWDVPGLGMQAWSDNRLPYKMFPSIKPGQSVKISDIVGGDKE